LGGAAIAALTATVSASRAARAEASRAMPVIFVSHGSPMLAIDRARGAELRAWGATLPRPRGILVMTPHYAARELALGATGRGFAVYSLPDWLKRRLPQDLDYPSPPSEALAAEVLALLRGATPV